MSLPQRFVAGEPDAFVDLARLVVPRMRRVVRRLVSDPGLAEDVVQESLLRVHLARERFRGGTPERAGEALLRWCLGIARNTAIDGIRREHRHQRGRLHDTSGIPDPSDADAETLWIAAERQEADRARVEAAIRELPPGARRVVELHRIDGLSMADIAAELGVRPGTVRVRAHRGMMALGRVLAGPAPESESPTPRTSGAGR